MFNKATSNRLLYTLFTAQSLFAASQIAVFTLLSIMAVELSGSESAAGLPSSTMTLTQAVAAYPLGILMGRFGRRLGLSLGYATASVGAFMGIVAILAGSFPLLLLSAALMGTGRASSEQSRFAAGELFPDDLRARMIGRIVFAGTIGAIGGPLLVGPSSTFAESLRLDPNTGPWLIAMVLFASALVLIFTLLRPDPMTIARQINSGTDKLKNEEPDAPGRPLMQILAHPSVRLAIFAMVISQTVMVVLMVITPLHMHHHNYESESVSLVIAAHTLGMFGLSGVTGYLIDRFGRTRMMVAGAVTLIAAAVISPLSTEMVFLVSGLFLLGLGWNFGYIAGSTLLGDTLEGQERARVQGFNDMLVAGCAGFGSLLSGPLFDIGGYTTVGLAGLALTLFLIVLIWRFSIAQIAQNPA